MAESKSERGPLDPKPCDSTLLINEGQSRLVWCERATFMKQVHLNW